MLVDFVPSSNNELPRPNAPNVKRVRGWVCQALPLRDGCSILGQDTLQRQECGYGAEQGCTEKRQCGGFGDRGSNGKRANFSAFGELKWSNQALVVWQVSVTMTDNALRSVV